MSSNINNNLCLIYHTGDSREPQAFGCGPLKSNHQSERPVGEPQPHAALTVPAKPQTRQEPSAVLAKVNGLYFAHEQRLQSTAGVYAFVQLAASHAPAKPEELQQRPGL